MLTIRLQRGGRVHKPVYTIVSTDSRNARDGRYLERLGQYNPHNAEGELSAVRVDRINALLANGATISDTVRTLLKRNNIQLG